MVFEFYSRNTLVCDTINHRNLLCPEKGQYLSMLVLYVVVHEIYFQSNQWYRLHKQQLWEIFLFFLLFIIPCCFF